MWAITSMLGGEQVGETGESEDNSFPDKIKMKPVGAERWPSG
jgi:hypothetical protein